MSKLKTNVGCSASGRFCVPVVGFLLMLCACSIHPQERSGVRRVDSSQLDSSGRSQFEAVRESINEARSRQDSTWLMSARMREKPELDVKWESALPTVHSSGVAGETFYWIEFDPYVVNTGSDTLRIDHVAPLGTPFCRVYHRGRKLRLHDYGAIWNTRSTLTIPPSEPFVSRSGTCTIPIRREGIYVVVAKAMVFSSFSAEENDFLNWAHRNLHILQAIRFERRMRRTQPLHIRSKPLVIEVR